MSSTILHVLKRIFPVGIWVRIGHQNSWRDVNGTILQVNRVNHSPMSLQVWHDKDPSLGNGRKRRAKSQVLQPSIGNGDLLIHVRCLRRVQAQTLCYVINNSINKIAHGAQTRHKAFLREGKIFLKREIIIISFVLF